MFLAPEGARGGGVVQHRRARWHAAHVRIAARVATKGKALRGVASEAEVAGDQGAREGDGCDRMEERGGGVHIGGMRRASNEHAVSHIGRQLRDRVALCRAAEGVAVRLQQPIKNGRAEAVRSGGTRRREARQAGAAGRAEWLQLLV